MKKRVFHKCDPEKNETPRDTAVAWRHNTVGIFKLLMPLFKLIAGRSRRREAELISKYC